MNDHIVDYRESGPVGMIAELVPHRGLVDWFADGTTCDPESPCSAISATSNERCGKREAVVVLTSRAKYASRVTAPIDLFLCGGHFNSHRGGRPVRVIVVPGRRR